MPRRKPKPDPVVDLTAAEADAHARAESVTDPAAFEFPVSPSTASSSALAIPAPSQPEPAPLAGSEPPSATAPRTEPDAAERPRPRDPLPIAGITLGAEKDSPRMQLFRSDRFKQVAIRFDQKPEPKYLEMLRDDGFKWRQDEGVWTKQFDADARWRTVADAEKLFAAVGNGIRADLGLSPVQVLGA